MFDKSYHVVKKEKPKREKLSSTLISFGLAGFLGFGLWGCYNLDSARMSNVRIETIDSVLKQNPKLQVGNRNYFVNARDDGYFNAGWCGIGALVSAVTFLGGVYLPSTKKEERNIKGK